MQVLELPPGGLLLAESATAPVEMWTLPSGNVLAVQASPCPANASAPPCPARTRPDPPPPVSSCGVAPRRAHWQRFHLVVPSTNLPPTAALQGHAELSAEETLDKIHSAVTAAGRLSTGAPLCCCYAHTTWHSACLLWLWLYPTVTLAALCLSACCLPACLPWLFLH